MKKASNMVIAQSGGPSMVINASMVGAVMAVRKFFGKKIGKIYGARHGIAGILGRDYIDLRKVPEKKMWDISRTPSSALGSCRLKPTADDCRKIFQEFKRLGVGYFFYIGGNDSAEAAAKYTRSLPGEFIAKNGHDVTPAFLEYAKPLVGELPFCETF